jgi:hypothetical protein
MSRATSFTLLILLHAFPLAAQPRTYPPLSEYLMPKADEMRLAKSAAPAAIADRASIKVLTSGGYVVAHTGDSGAVCLVMRGFTAPTFTPAAFRDIVYDPTIRAPICFMPEAVRVVLPYYELRTALAMQGKTPDDIATGIQAAYKSGKLPRRDQVTFAYMWSAHQHLGPGIDAWRPHMMVFAPNLDNAMLGGNAFGGPLPAVTDDGGTPFSVLVIPVDPALAVGSGASH